MKFRLTQSDRRGKSIAIVQGTGVFTVKKGPRACNGRNDRLAQRGAPVLGPGVERSISGNPSRSVYGVKHT